MSRFWLAFVAVLFIALPAHADGTWRKGSEQDNASSRSADCGNTLTRQEICYHTLRASDDDDSDSIQITNGASMCLEPDITTTGAVGASATIRLRYINVSKEQFDVLTGTDKEEVSSIISVGATSILDGDDTVNPQTACFFSIPPGLYYVEVVTAPGASDEMVVKLASH